MNAKMILVLLFSLVLFGIAFAALPASCNTPNKTSTIGNTYSMYWGLYFDTTSNYSNCLKYTFTADTTFTANLMPHFFDFWDISIFDSLENKLCDANNRGNTKITCSADVLTGGTLFTVFSSNSLSNHSTPTTFANGYTINITTKAIPPIAPILPTCSEGWKCKDSSNGGYQHTDCSWTSVSYCEAGCSNTMCNPIPQPTPVPQQTCSAGWKCKDSSNDGYQHEDCSWTSVSNCQYGCSGTQCNNPPEPAPNPTPQPTCTPEWKCVDSLKLGNWLSTCGWGEIIQCTNGCSNNKCNDSPAPISTSTPDTTPELEKKYCVGNDIYENGKKEWECAGLCSDGKCSEWSNGRIPSIKSIFKTTSIESGYIASYEWAVFGYRYLETGAEVSFDGINWVKKEAVRNWNNHYLMLISPSKNHPILYIRAYAKYTKDGIQKTIYGTKQTIFVTNQATPTNNRFTYSFGEINLLALGWEGAKLFTVGSCIDNGLVDFWCALDVASTVGLAISIVNPADAELPDVAIASAKLSVLAKSGNILKTIKTGTEFGNAIKTLNVTYKDAKFVVEGAKIGKLLDKGIIKIVDGKIRTSFPKLFRYALEKGDYSIMRLMGKGTSKELLEQAVKNGADLGKTKFITQNPRTIAWLEEGIAGDGGWGLAHMEERGHITQIANALQIKYSEVQGVIKTVIEIPTYSITNTARNSYEFYKIYYVEGEERIVQVVVSSTNVGRIVTATIVKKIPV